MTLKKLMSPLVLLTCLGAHHVCLADQFADEARELLITKFERLHQTMAPADPAYIGMTLRLADLLSEKGRAVQNLEDQKGCLECTHGAADRQKALMYYQQALPKLAGIQKQKVTLQIGDIFEKLDQPKKATDYYQKALGETQDPTVRAEILMSLGELNYKRRNYTLAESYYQQSVSIPELKRKALANYRLAWCKFQTGKIQPSVDLLTKILMTPELLTTNPDLGVVSVDSQFQQEVSKDLVTFMVKLPVQKIDFMGAYKLFQDSVKQENTIFLANELERLGAKDISQKIWEFAFDQSKNPEEKIEILSHLIVINREAGQLDKSNQLTQNLFALLATDAGCVTDICKTSQTRLRQNIVNWNKAEKLAPSQALAAAYEAYLQRFPADNEMTIWAAQVATMQKDFKKSAQYYLGLTKAANVAPAQVEEYWLKSLDLAEQSKDKDYLAQVRNSYLEKSPKKSMAFEVRYQAAFEQYDAGDNATSGKAFNQLVGECAAQQNKNALCIKAANLSLDAMANLKDNKTIATWAAQYASLWPNDKSGFINVLNKTSLNEAAALADTNRADAWRALSAINETSLTGADHISYLKNKIILAEKLKKFADARQAAKDLLAIKEINVADKQFATSRLAWFLELSFDFAGAYKYLAQVQSDDFSGEARELKLAVLCELSYNQECAIKHYQALIGLTGDVERQTAVAYKVVDLSKNKTAAIKQYQKYLAHQPDALADLLLETELYSELKSNKALAQTAAYQILSKEDFLQKTIKWNEKISAHQLESKTQRDLQKTLKARIALIDEGDKILGDLVQAKDGEVQLILVSALAKQTKRFYDDLVGLPLPEGLTPDEQNQYLGLLNQKATPFQLRATELNTKIDEFFLDTAASQNIINKTIAAKGLERKILLGQAEALKNVLPEKYANQFVLTPPAVAKDEDSSGLIVHPAVKVALEKARMAAIEDPINAAKLHELLQLEKSAGNTVMTSYLESRIASADISANQNQGNKK